MRDSTRSTARRHDGEISKVKTDSARMSQVIGGESKAVPKRKFPALESTLARTGLEGPGQLHLEMQQTAVNGFLRADGTTSSDQGRAFSFQAAIGMKSKPTSQVTARQVFVTMSMSRQRRGVIASSSEQSKQFDPGG